MFLTRSFDTAELGRVVRHNREWRQRGAISSVISQFSKHGSSSLSDWSAAAGAAGGGNQDSLETPELANTPLWTGLKPG